jgi:hypothetical protein
VSQCVPSVGSEVGLSIFPLYSSPRSNSLTGSTETGLKGERYIAGD